MPKLTTLRLKYRHTLVYFTFYDGVSKTCNDITLESWKLIAFFENCFIADC